MLVALKRWNYITYESQACEQTWCIYYFIDRLAFVLNNKIFTKYVEQNRNNLKSVSY